jgi:SAM-dependent methyltransferase
MERSGPFVFRRWVRGQPTGLNRALLGHEGLHQRGGPGAAASLDGGPVTQQPDLMRPADDLYERQKRYYHCRAREYDATAWPTTDEAGRHEVADVVAALAAFPPARTLDVACGTGFLTRHLPGAVVALDQSEAMLEEARGTAPRATFLQGDALALPVPNQSFDRVFTAHFYGHLDEPERVVVVAQSTLRLAGGDVVPGDPAFVTGTVEGVASFAAHAVESDSDGVVLGDAAALGEVIVVGT